MLLPQAVPALLFLIVSAAPAPGAGGEPQEQLKERDRLGTEAKQLKAKGQLAEALAAAVKKLAIERKVLGDAHEDVAGSLRLVGDIQEERDDLAAARTAWQESLAIEKKLHGDRHWRATNARAALAHLESVARLEPAQRRRYGEIHPLMRKVEALDGQNQFRQAIAPCRQVLAIHKELLGEENVGHAEHLYWLGWLYGASGDYARAEPLMRAALELRTKLLGREHPSCATSLDDLGWLHDRQGKLAPAEALWRQALAIRKKTLPAGHTDTRDNLRKLANVLEKQGKQAAGKDPAGAERLYTQALAFRKQALGEKHLEYVASLVKLAALYYSRGEYAKALPLFEQLRDVRKQLQGAKHLAYAVSLIDLATLYQDLGEYARGVPLLEEALAIRKEAQGDKHPDHADTLNRLALLYDAWGHKDLERADFAAARKAFQTAVVWKTRLRGEKHWEVTDARLAVANVERLARLTPEQRRHLKQAEDLAEKAIALAGEKKLDQAIAVGQQCLHIREQVLGNGHPDCATVLNYLGLWHFNQGDADKAEPLWQKALEVRKAVLGTDHPDFALSLNNLGALYFRKGDRVRAAALHREAAAIRGRLLGETHADTIHSLIDLAVTLEQLAGESEAREDFASAGKTRTEALALRLKVRGEGHPEVIDARVALDHTRRLARLAREQRQQLREAVKLDARVQELAGQGKHKEAVALAARALEIRKQLLGTADLDCARALDTLAGLHGSLKDHGQALPLYEQALRIRRKALGDKHADYAAGRKRLAELYNEAVGKLIEERGLDEAPAVIAVAEKRLAFQREVFGPVNRDVAGSLMTLAKLYELREDFPAALKAHEERLALLTKLVGANHPQIGDARFALANVRRLARLTPGQRRQLMEARELHVKAGYLVRDGKLKEARAAVEKALTIRKAVLGEYDTACASSLTTLARLHQKKKEHAAAEPLFRQVVAINEKALGAKHPIYADSLDCLATVYRETGDYARAEPLYRQALAILTVAHDEAHPDCKATAGNLADLLGRRAKRQERGGDFSSAQTARREALAILTRLHGDRDWRTIDARLALVDGEHLAGMTPVQRRRLAEAEDLHEQAVALGSKGKEAIPLARKAVEIRKELLGEAHHQCAASLYVLGAAHARAGEWARAQPLLQKADTALKQNLGERHPIYIINTYSLGMAYRGMRDYARAELRLRQAADLQKEVLGEKGPGYATCLDALAELYLQTGDYPRAESLCRQVLALYETTLRENFPKYIKDVGIEHMAIRAEVRGGQHPEYVACLRQLARVYMEMGRTNQAAPLLRQVLDSYRQSPGEKSADYGSALNDVAWLALVMGDYARAEPLFRQALEVLERIPAGAEQPCAVCLNNLARLYYLTGEYVRAEEYYRKALGILARVRGEEHLDYAVALDNLALLLAARKDYVGAEPLYRRALEIKKKVIGDKHPSYGTSLNNLGELHQATGSYSRAEQLFRQALTVYRPTLGEKHREFVITQGNLAEVYWLQGDHARAEPLMRQALETASANLELTAAVQSERQQLAMLRALRSRLDDYLALAAQAGKSGEAVYPHVLAWKGRVSLRQRRLHLMRQHPEFKASRVLAPVKNKDGKYTLIIGPLANRFEQLEGVTRSLATLALAVPNPKQQDARRRLIQELTEQKEWLETEIARDSGAFRQDQTAARRTPAQIQAALPADTVLIDFLEYNHSRPSSGGKERWTSERHLAAFVLRRHGPLAQFDLGPIAPIADAVEAWRTGFGRSAPGNKNAPGAVLRRLLWDRLAGSIEGARTVLVSPDGALGRLPFGALPGSKPGRYLIEEHAVAVVPVVRLLPELLANAEPAGAPSLLLVGAVNFNAAAGLPETVAANRSAPRGGLRDWGPLEGTRAEVGAIRESFGRRYGRGRVTELREAAPTESAVRAQAPRHRYLHFATHGFFAPPQLRSALAAASRASIPSAAELFAAQNVDGFNPGLLSGLVLAGANQPAAPNKDDGILTALEVTELDLSGVDLATLSACETGLGEDAGGEGLLGLQRAFQVAGARTVVASLWQVPDRATQALMTRFYDNLWGKKMGKLQALREAQLWMLRHGARSLGRRRGSLARLDEERPAQGPLPPYYWAAFVLSGSAGELGVVADLEPELAGVPESARGAETSLPPGEGPGWPATMLATLLLGLAGWARWRTR